MSVTNPVAQPSGGNTLAPALRGYRHVGYSQGNRRRFNALMEPEPFERLVELMEPLGLSYGQCIAALIDHFDGKPTVLTRAPKGESGFEEMPFFGLET